MTRKYYGPRIRTCDRGIDAGEDEKRRTGTAVVRPKKSSQRGVQSRQRRCGRRRSELSLVI